MRAVLLLCWALLAWLAPAAAQDLLPVPQLTARVIDQTGTLDDIQRKGIEDKLAALEQSKGTQVAMLMVATTQPEDIASYANRVGNEWKIGRKGVGDGVLLVVAKNDRKVRIEVAKTLEGAIPDLAAKQIIDEAITPRFRQGDFAGGLQAAADQLVARIKGEPLPPVQQPAPAGAARGGFDWMDLAIFLFFAVPIAGGVLRRIFGRKLGSLVTGGGVAAVALMITSSIVIAAVAGIVGLLFSMMSGLGGGLGSPRRGGWGGGPFIGGGWGGGGGGSWGGGGGGWGGSGGGGDFGGGGASGDW
ncbi:TPM domain-containing protein [Ramlibacter sp.]|uniref:TPM domain-containing protein n=1 Tax=Ramlibacter sp. TaxID=1917967 RepID=UPI002B8C5555|nr:TPM domain-containing protein [Ramlibacter sp.]HWI81554.1 TPM domain-containing protein [Ramlibacter sp.]